ncbi:MAG TPA: M23 family metallopeptidase [Chitinophagaceae bacterium]|nr:M23 family metallopeptidase [Chitinophagaceae bacterium]
MLRNFSILILFIFSPCILFSQPKPNYPKYYFRNPLGIPMDLTANMGELRADHWHMGLDLRTGKKENLPVYAAAGGYIAKVRIEKFGYGRSIYINHPNGMTTVYGHLNNFFPALEKYVTEQQYKKQTWEIELNFSKNKFPVFKSELIAYSGSTGNSQGPHLHFEIRDTKTTKCLNPLLFRFPVKDDVPPEILQLAIYDRSISVYRQDPELFSLKKTTDSGYIIASAPVIQTGLRKISFAIQAFDRMKRSGSADGIYSAKIYFDNKPVIGFVLDSIDYNESEYVNAQIDYKFHYNGGAYLQHLSLMPGDHGVAYKKINGDGIFDLNDSGFHLVHIEVRDAYNNRSKLNFMVQHVDSLERPELADTLQKFIPNQVNVFEKPDFEMYLPEKSLYDTVPVIYYRNISSLPNSVSAIHQLNDPSFPLHTAAFVRIKPDRKIPEDLKNKIVIKRSDQRSSSIRKAEWQQDWLSAKFGDFGNFQAFIDTVPPEIKDIGTEDTTDFSRGKNIIIEARDNFEEIKKFKAEIDGQWIRFTNDKSGPFIYDFDERCPYGVHQLKVTVEDIVGNSTTKTWWFKRYPYTPSPKKTRHKKKNSSVKRVIIKKETKTQ